MSENISLAQGPAKLATAEDIAKDTVGITYPNLHRRIDEDRAATYEETYWLTENLYFLTTEDDLMITSDVAYSHASEMDFALTVNAVNSYRTSAQIVHNEDSDDSEIP